MAVLSSTSHNTLLHSVCLVLLVVEDGCSVQYITEYIIAECLPGVVDVEDGWSVRESHRFPWLPDWGEGISVVMVVRMVGIVVLIVVGIVFVVVMNDDGDHDIDVDDDGDHDNDDDDDADYDDDEPLTVPARRNSQ